MHATERIVFITGATDGIGKQTALELLLLGCSVVLHGRTTLKAEQAAAELRKVMPNAVVYPVGGDLSRQAEVHSIAEQAAAAVPRIDTVINNAGVYMRHFETDEHGTELTAAVNHLSHFLLTGLLLPMLRRSPHGRVVTVSSMAHARGTYAQERFSNSDMFTPYGAYAFSKLCNILFANRLSEKLIPYGITSNSLHPGVISTKLLLHGFGISGGGLAEGARTSVLLACGASVANVTGAYFSAGKQQPPSPACANSAYQDNLWKVSESLCGIRY